jgi:bacteriocin biosynthesis cyclodehydratase domain-containing protein
MSTEERPQRHPSHNVPEQLPSLGAGSPSKLHSVPVHLVGLRDGVVLARGCTEIHISGARASAIVQLIISAAAGDGATREEIQGHFDIQDRDQVDNLVTELLRRGLLLQADASKESRLLPGPNGEESSLDVFYWHFGTSQAEVQRRLALQRLAVIGVNALSRHLIAALQAVGFSHFEVVDHPLLRNQRMFQAAALRAGEWTIGLPDPLPYEHWRDTSDLDALTCVVATADFGGQALMRSWNEFCVVNRCTFFPIVLDRLVGFIGPLVVPGETACYECLQARENANEDEYVLRRALQQSTIAIQRQAVCGFHPSMPSIVADLAALELHKFFSRAMPSNLGTLLEVSLLQPGLTARKPLKLPRCPVCSPLNKRAGRNPDKMGFLGGPFTEPPEQ